MQVVRPEPLLTMVVGGMIPKRSGIGHSRQHKMIKSVAALAIFAVLGASVIALPGFPPKVEASEAVALAKADRLAVRAVPRNCFKQVWPDFATACLRNGGSGAKIVEARLVTARR
jgi:hypothetical protein